MDATSEAASQSEWAELLYYCHAAQNVLDSYESEAVIEQWKSEALSQSESSIQKPQQILPISVIDLM